MNIIELKTSRKLFWYIQIPAWIVFTFLTLLLYHEKTFADGFNLFFHVFEYFLGFIGSLILRYILKLLNQKSKTLLTVSIIIVISSIVCGHFWLLSANYFWVVFAQGIFTFDYIFNMTVSGYTFRLFWITLIYCGWGALYFLIKTWLSLQNQTEQTLKAQSLVKEAQLQMLRYQLNPHFLFNSLNSIAVLIDENKDKAKRDGCRSFRIFKIHFD
ncbi:MAG: histidine kinase [bacterium]